MPTPSRLGPPAQGRPSPPNAADDRIRRPGSKARTSSLPIRGPVGSSGSALEQTTASPQDEASSSPLRLPLSNEAVATGRQTRLPRSQRIGPDPDHRRAGRGGRIQPTTLEAEVEPREPPRRPSGSRTKDACTHCIRRSFSPRSAVAVGALIPPRVRAPTPHRRGVRRSQVGGFPVPGGCRTFPADSLGGAGRRS
jgi:hypothetical protein